MINEKSIIRFRWQSYILFIVLISMVSCYPKGPKLEEELNLVGTAFDDQFNFDDVNSYIMPDSIVFIISEDVSNKDMPSRDNEEMILEQIATHFDAIGYERLTSNSGELADVVILVSAAVDTKTGNYSSWWRFWGWYPDWSDYPYVYDPSWFYDVPFLFFPVVFEYKVGSLIITIVNPDGSNDTTKEISVVWIGAINGILTNEKNNLNSISEGLDKMFAQSPYL